MNIPFHKPSLNRQTKKLFDQVVNSGWLTTGRHVNDFEAGVKQLLGFEYAKAVSSCTAALHLAYIVLGLKKGDEVIVPSFTFCSTINMVIHVGATPVFCDIDERTLCLDPIDVSRKMTSRTKAVVVIHFAGMPADLNAIKKICKKRKIPIVEDAAHAFLTKYQGDYIGNHGNIVCFSFYATKTLTTAEGGLIVTLSQKQLKKVKMLALHGLSENAWSRYDKKGSWKYRVLTAGYKYNMSNVHAAIGLSQLPHVVKEKGMRIRYADEYRRLLKKVPEIILPINPPYKKSEHSWHLFTIRMRDPEKRDLLIEYLKKHGVGTSVHFIPNHQQPYYRKFNRVVLPTTETVGKSILSLPIYPDLGFEKIHKITDLIKGFFRYEK